MKAWGAVAIMLACINLVRITRKAWLGAIVSFVAVAGLGLLAGGGSGVLYVFVAAAISGMAVGLWPALSLGESTLKVVSGLSICVMAAVGQILLLRTFDCEPGSFVLHLVAVSLLAEPMTRVLRFSLGLMGKDMVTGPGSYGR